MFKVIESKEEFFAAARAGLLWGNYQKEEAGPSRWEALSEYTLKWLPITSEDGKKCTLEQQVNNMYGDIWATAEENRKADPREWRTFDFAVLVEDDGEGDSPEASVASED